LAQRGYTDRCTDGFATVLDSQLERLLIRALFSVEVWSNGAVIGWRQAKKAVFRVTQARSYRNQKL
jgi:hypothetical protein